MQRQTAVTAYIKSKQLLLFVFALLNIQQMEREAGYCNQHVAMATRLVSIIKNSAGSPVGFRQARHLIESSMAGERGGGR